MNNSYMFPIYGAQTISILKKSAGNFFPRVLGRFWLEYKRLLNSSKLVDMFLVSTIFLAVEVPGGKRVQNPQTSIQFLDT